MTAVFTLAIVAVAVHALRMRLRISRHERMHTIEAGWISVELWRKASLVAHHDVSGIKTFPLPQETRTRLWRCAGLPFRCEIQSLGLPTQVTDQICSVDGAQFDALFSAEFRRSSGLAAPRTETSVHQARPSRL